VSDDTTDDRRTDTDDHRRQLAGILMRAERAAEEYGARDPVERVSDVTERAVAEYCDVHRDDVRVRHVADDHPGAGIESVERLVVEWVDRETRADGGRVPLRRFTGECECGRRVVTAIRRPNESLSADPTASARCGECGSTLCVEADPPAEQRKIRTDGGREISPALVARIKQAARRAREAAQEDL